MKRALLLLSLAAVAVGCDRDDSATGPADAAPEVRAASKANPPGGPTPGTAVITFGDPGSGSPFPPEIGHDASGHAADKLVPGTVVIERGGSVTFVTAPFHQTAIYEPGTQPEDIEVSPATLEDVNFGPFSLPDFRINDPDGRLALGPGQSLAPASWTSPPGTFDEPGRYLVICTTTPHFLFASMWGWVIVK